MTPAPAEEESLTPHANVGVGGPCICLALGFEAPLACLSLSVLYLTYALHVPQAIQ